MCCLLILAGCTNLPFRLESSPQAGVTTPEKTLAPTIPATTDAVETKLIGTQESTPVATAQATGTSLRIWLPPEFDPESNSVASVLLKNRLKEFTVENPKVKLEVRVKALSGAGGLLESLAATSVSASLVLPDLVLLPRPLLESAALKGLLTPYDGLTDTMNERNWFEYAQQLAQLKTSIYGLPFAGDAMVMAYHPSLIDGTPRNLDAIVALGKVLLFSASDPQALFTLGLYMDGGGDFQDAQGRPYLEESSLLSVFEYDQRASLAGVMPYWLTQYSEDEQVWESFLEDQYPMAITWVYAFMKNWSAAPDDLAMAPIPTWDSTPFTLATGWSWALAGQDSERRTMSVRLAEFLIDKEFMAEWTSAAGYLPTRTDAFLSWGDDSLRQMARQISYSARLMPPADLISSLGPALEEAVVGVLKAEIDPQTAVLKVIEQINQP